MAARRDTALSGRLRRSKVFGPERCAVTVVKIANDPDELPDAGLVTTWAVHAYYSDLPHCDQLTRETTHLSARFRSIHRWLPKAYLGVESSADENVVS